MRKDTQIGVILGVVILGIIAVFLSTRTNVDKQIDRRQVNNRHGSGLNDTQKGLDIYEDDIFIENTLDSDFEENAIVSINEISDVIENKSVNVIEDKSVNLVSDDKIVVAESDKDKTFVEIFESIRADSKVDDEMVINESVEEDDGSVVIESTVKTKIKNTISLTHKVELNDNLFSLAKKYYGDPKKWMTIYNANDDVIYDRNSLPVGDELIIPDVKVLDGQDEDDEVVVHSQTVDKVATASVNKSSEQLAKQSSSQSSEHRIHVVESGDSLYRLARDYYGDSKEWVIIYNANRDKIGENRVLLIGNKIRIPVTEKITVNEKGTDVYTLKSETTASETTKNEKQKSKTKIYKIEKGDTLYKISKLHYGDGTRWKEIFEANKEVLNNSTNIKAGKNIVIP